MEKVSPLSLSSWDFQAESEKRILFWIWPANLPQLVSNACPPMYICWWYRGTCVQKIMFQRPRSFLSLFFFFFFFSIPFPPLLFKPHFRHWKFPLPGAEEFFSFFLRSVFPPPPKPLTAVRGFVGVMSRYMRVQVGKTERMRNYKGVRLWHVGGAPRGLAAAWYYGIIWGYVRVHRGCGVDGGA